MQGIQFGNNQLIMKIKKIILILSLFLFSGCSYLFDENHTSLMKAVFENNITKVKALILETDNIDEVDAYGWTALAHASYSGQDEIVKLLLEEGANINSYSSEQGFFIQFIGSKLETTVLAKAVDERHISTAKILIENGAFIDKYSIYKLGSAGDIRLIEIMLNRKNKAILDKSNFYSLVLSGASSWGDLEMVTYLINHGANPNEIDNNALLATVHNVQLEIAEYLSKHGADVNIKLKESSILSQATSSVCASKKRDNKLKIIKLLVNHGADKNFKPNNGDKTIVELVRNKIQEYKEKDKKVAEYFSTILMILEKGA